MTLWNRVRAWLRANLYRSTGEREMAAEFQFHLEVRVEDLIRTGLPLKKPCAAPASNSAVSNKPKNNAAKRAAPPSSNPSRKICNLRYECSAKVQDLRHSCFLRWL